MEILIKQYEMYEIMAKIFFDLLDKDKKILAMTLAAEEIRLNVLSEVDQCEKE